MSILKSDTQPPLKLLLVDYNSHKTHILSEAFDNEHYQIEWASASGMPLLHRVRESKPDIIIIDIESPDRDMLDSLNMLSATAPKPVVMFSEDQNSQVITELVKAGVSAYITGGVDTQRVRSIIDIALARFKEHQNLKQELADTKQKLSSQKVIEQAKIWLMENKHCSEKQAYHHIRKIAMDNSQKMEDVARNILSLANMLGGSHG
ncbi:ANTAR domain-containing response regulator [Thalassotalea litorea]|uniref:ANTAR domain-containing response regulator n=1 Tax=Thalassotalea litorea TaxID=2020715 RepID=UPI003736C942